MPKATCYLCNRPIEHNENSDDHIVPKTLINRKQPRVKGYDYAGKLPSHRECNNQFGPETYASKALDLIAALHDPKSWFKYPHPANPSLLMMAVKSTALPNFTPRDLQFFKIIDAQTKSKAEIYDLALLDGREPTNPTKLATHTALSVLTKSAAALLISRHLRITPPSWDILAIPYVGEADAVDLDDVFGSTIPFDREVKVWIDHLETEDYLVVYRAKRVIVYFLFRFSVHSAAWNKMLSRFKGGSRLRFQGTTLNELVNYPWKEA